MAYLGQNTPDPSAGNSPANDYLWSYKATADGSGGTTSKLYIFATNTSGGNRTISVAIYSDVAGHDHPYQPLAAAVSITIPANTNSPAWFSADYMATLVASTQYWLAWTSSTGTSVYYDAAASGTTNYGGAAGTLPATWDNGLDFWLSRSYGVYAVYAAAAGTPLPVFINLQRQFRN